MVDAHVDDAQVEAVLTAEHVAAATPTREVDHLLPRDLTGRQADALALDAVVASQQQVAGVLQRGAERLLDEAYLQGQLLESSERALGFVQVVDMALDVSCQPPVRAFDIEVHFHVNVSISL